MELERSCQTLMVCNGERASVRSFRTRVPTLAAAWSDQDKAVGVAFILNAALFVEGNDITDDRDAGGDDLEEAAVCYLQIVLADEIDGVGRERLMRDMDAWGYSFRLGSTRAWFQEDAEDAAGWLQQHGLIDAADSPTFALRGGV